MILGTAVKGVQFGQEWCFVQRSITPEREGLKCNCRVFGKAWSRAEELSQHP